MPFGVRTLAELSDLMMFCEKKLAQRGGLQLLLLVFALGPEPVDHGAVGEDVVVDKEGVFLAQV
jgi:hypothetical protein